MLCHSRACLARERRWIIGPPACATSYSTSHIPVFSSLLYTRCIMSPAINSMDTATPRSAHTERPKRARIDLSSPAHDQEIERALDQLRSDSAVPSYMKNLLTHLMDSKDHVEWLLQQCRELQDEVATLREENKILRNVVSQHKSL